MQNPMCYIDFGQLPAHGYKAFSQSFASKTSSLNEGLILPAAEHSLFLLRSLASVVCRADITHRSNSVIQ